MIDKIYIKITDLLPVIGGAGGAATQANKINEYFPTMEVIISTIIISALGAAIGYIVKLMLDRVFKKESIK